MRLTDINMLSLLLKTVRWLVVAEHDLPTVDVPLYYVVKHKKGYV